jgi:ubiquinone/menaquinone biosynthesis C-methylase UbiE
MDTLAACFNYQSIVSKHARFVDRPFVREVLRKSASAQTLLDVGTGPGLIPLSLGKARPDLAIHAVDLSANMLALAQLEACEQGVDDRIVFEQADAKALPYPDDSFDGVICHAMLHHLADPTVALKEMVRVLRPGGRMLVKDIRRPPAWAIPLCVTLLGGAMGYSRDEKGIYEESLRAAYTADEIRAVVRGTPGLAGASVRRTFPAHFTIECTKN